MKELRLKLHGIPGVGVTGDKGEDGIRGNSIYMGMLDEFFTIDGVQSKTLNSIYKDGDIIYITNSSRQIEYMIYIDKSLENSKKEELLRKAIKTKPFTFPDFNVVGNKIVFNRPLDILNIDGYEDSSLNINNITTKNNNPVLSLSTILEITPTLSVNTESAIDDDTLSDIIIKLKSDYINPIYYNPDRNEKNSYVNIRYNGDSQYVFTYSANELNKIISCKSTDSEFDIEAKSHNTINFNTNGKSLKISNLYIKPNNIGNIDTHNIVINNGLYIDIDGNAYTLSSDDFDVSTYLFTINETKLKIDNDSNIEYGYVHRCWNNSLEDTSIYMPNNIMNYINTNNIYRVPMVVNNSYIKHWETINDIKDNIIKDILSLTYDSSTLKDVIDESLYEKNPYKNYLTRNGIIETVNTTKQETILQYNTALTIDDISTDIMKVDTLYSSDLYCVNNPSNNIISLNKKDKFGNLYKHQDILLWVKNEKNIKFYSKHTQCEYDDYNNTFIITSGDVVEQMHDDLSLNLFTFNINGLNVLESTCLVEAYAKDVNLIDFNAYVDDQNTNGSANLTWANTVSIETFPKAESTANCKISINAKSNLPYLQTTITGVLKRENLLEDIFNSSIQNTLPREATIAIVYNKKDDPDKKYVDYTKVIQPGYTETRTIPKINLHIYDLLEELEQINSIDNGVLCNLMLLFMDINISDFDDTNWGKYSNLLIPTLSFNISTEDNDIDFAKEYNLHDYNRNTYVSYTTDDDIDLNITATVQVINSDIDIFNTKVKDYYTEDNSCTFASIQTGSTFNSTINNGDSSTSGNKHSISILFNNLTIKDATQKKIRVRIFIESKNPIPTRIYYKFKVSDVKVTYNDGTEYAVTSSMLEHYKTENIYISNKFDGLIYPISYIAAPNSIQNVEDYPMQLTVGKNYIGSTENICTTIEPYNGILTSDAYYHTQDELATGNYINWNSINVKRRYFQDNIQNISITPININYIKDSIITNNDYTKFIVDDPDDIELTYLNVTYNATYFLPMMYKDQMQFIYNSSLYLSSKYSLKSNNSGIFIELYDSYLIRDFIDLNSIEYWNKKYNDSSCIYDKHNVVLGHIEGYGNGYNYLEDYYTDSYKENLKSLQDTKLYNNEYIFNEPYKGEIKYKHKNSTYYPNEGELFRTLLYNILWQYPVYDYDKNNDIVTISPYSLDYTGVNNTYPYNLAYSIYPRSLYDDENDINIIMMLRKPSIVKEHQYSLKKEDLCYKTLTTSITTDPENNMNILYQL